MSDVRLALRSDEDRVVETLARAFTEDPVTRWLLGPGDGYDERLRLWKRFGFETGLAHGHTYVADDIAGAAIWCPPDTSLFSEPFGQRLGEMLAEWLGETGLPRLKDMAEVGKHHVEEPHFYLFMLGTDPRSQSRGLGSALIEHVLALCDRQHLPAHLESSNPRNIPFYQRHGFEVVTQIELEPGGPIISPMRRAPR